MNFRFTIENFKPSTPEGDDGFALNYIIAMDFLNAAPSSSENAPISF